MWAVLRLEVMFKKRSGVFYRGIKPRDEAAPVYWKTSKTFHEKRVSCESEQRLKLWGEYISMHEKQATLYQYSFHKEY